MDHPVDSLTWGYAWNCVAQWLYTRIAHADGVDFRAHDGKAWCRHGTLFGCSGTWAIHWRFDWWPLCRSGWLLWVDELLGGAGCALLDQCSLYARPSP